MKRWISGQSVPKPVEDIACGLFMSVPCSYLPQSDGFVFSLLTVWWIWPNSSFGRRRSKEGQRRNCSQKGCPQRNSGNAMFPVVQGKVPLPITSWTRRDYWGSWRLALGTFHNLSEKRVISKHSVKALVPDTKISLTTQRNNSAKSSYFISQFVHSFIHSFTYSLIHLQKIYWAPALWYHTKAKTNLVPIPWSWHAIGRLHTEHITTQENVELLLWKCYKGKIHDAMRTYNKGVQLSQGEGEDSLMSEHRKLRLGGIN